MWTVTKLRQNSIEDYGPSRNSCNIKNDVLQRVHLEGLNPNQKVYRGKIFSLTYLESTVHVKTIVQDVNRHREKIGKSVFDSRVDNSTI